MNVTTKQRGFTLIEVILVLAIAALIFLMVFVALPALQASQRDTARRSDAGLVASAVQTYMSTERAALSAGEADLLVPYIDDLDQYENQEAADATSPGLRVLAAATGTVTVDSDQVNIYVGTKCDGNDLEAGVARSAAVVVQLETGSGTTYCVDV